ncbi:MAG: DUF2752 domain-containing protein [Pseudomonadota bacterium]
MLKAASSRSNPDATDIGIAIAVATLGVAALVVPELVLAVTPRCLVSMVTADLCWGCGITHAALALLHGDVAGAWAYNKLSLVVLPMLLWLYFQHLRMIWRGARPAFRKSHPRKMRPGR